MTTEICAWYNAGVEQREHEVERGEGLEGTIGWKQKGCYECKGLDKTKHCYYVLEEMEK